MSNSISLQALLESHDQPFVIIDANLTIRGVNKAYERHFGVPQVELTGQPCCRVTGTTERPADCRHRRLFRDLEPYFLIHEQRDDDGETRRFQVRGYPLIDAKQTIHLGESIISLRPQTLAAEAQFAGRSAAHHELLRQLDLAAGSPVPVLLLGETGCGKELAADYLHRHSSRRDHPFIVVDCTVLGEDLFESELFGYEKGAFTGALGQKKGLLEMADGGTLFLDEIGELPLSQQPKLLRALESGTFRRVGGTEQRHADVRVIAATHRHLRNMVNEGQFREDLYYRLAVFTIEIPPLRARRDDIAPIALTLLRQIGTCLNRPLMLTPAALARLFDHDYPGNVRELRNILQLAATLSQGPTIDVPHIVLPKPCTRPANARIGHAIDSPDPLAAMEIAYLKSLLDKHRGNRRQVAAEMNISERTLYRKLKRYGLNHP